MANRPAAGLPLRGDDRQQLVAMTRAPTLQAGLAQRARILLLAADGLSNTEIADKVGVSRPTVLVWRERYVERGLEGLVDRTRPGRRPRVAAPDVLAATLHAPPRRLAVTHWSSRLLGDELGIGRGSVVRAWQGYGLQPVRGGYRFATVPALAGRVLSVLALRLGAPESFVVLDVEEASRARERRQAVFAADALADLTRGLHEAAPARPDDPAGELLRFLDEVHRARRHWPTGSRLHLVTDGTGPVALPALREALAARSRITVHVARDRARWPEMLVGWVAMAAGGVDGPAVLPVLDRRQRALGRGEVFTWAYAADAVGPGAVARPATVN